MGAVYRVGLDLLPAELDASQVGVSTLEPVRLQSMRQPRRPWSQSSETLWWGKEWPASRALQDESELARREEASPFA